MKHDVNFLVIFPISGPVNKTIHTKRKVEDIFLCLDLCRCFKKKKKVNIYLFLRDRERQSMRGEGEDTESEAGSRF